MKLAEALQERADLNRKIQQLEDRLENNVLVQEGETTAEDPAELLAELDEAVDRLRELMERINRTNCAAARDGRTITAMIAERDALHTHLQVYRNVLSTASQTARRATRSEIKILSAVDVRALQKKADGLAKRLRQTDNHIQELNWSTELQ